MRKAGFGVVYQRCLGKAKDIESLVNEPYISIPILFKNAWAIMPILAIGLYDDLVKRKQEVNDVSAYTLLELKEQTAPLKFLSDYLLQRRLALANILTGGYGYTGTRMAAIAPVARLDALCPAVEAPTADFASFDGHRPCGSPTFVIAIDAVIGSARLDFKEFAALRAYLLDAFLPAKCRTLWAAIRAIAVAKARKEYPKVVAADFTDSLYRGSVVARHAWTLSRIHVSDKLQLDYVEPKDRR